MALIFNPKTVNPKYISMVAHSPLFLTDVVEYLNSRFIKDYRKSRYYKLDRIITTCFSDVLDDSSNFSRVKESIQNNPRFKIPWYDDELKKAVKGVQTYLVSKCSVPARSFVEPS